MAENGALWACGTLGRAHGLHGEMYVNLAPGGLEYLQEGERFYLYEEGAAAPRPVELQFAGGTARRPLVRVSAAGSRDAAAALTGATLFAAGGDLDQRPFYRVSELIGLRVLCGARELGVVSDVISAPANDVLEVTAGDGERVLLPLKDEIVTVDQAAGIATVIEGFL